ncbi:hypothetical protein [Streptomyces europaeiscabiei]|uniref:hypothetical protein n=1 Tax=Streptomyces europaeiscabiei TaxID=146819 RepID=UPI002E188D9D
MTKNNRLRRLVVGDTTWHWTVRQLPHPRLRGSERDPRRVARDHCRLKLSLYPEGPRRRRLVLLFGPSEDRTVSNCYFDSGALVRRSDHTYLNSTSPARSAASWTPPPRTWTSTRPPGRSRWTAGRTSTRSRSRSGRQAPTIRPDRASS